MPFKNLADALHAAQPRDPRARGGGDRATTIRAPPPAPHLRGRRRRILRRRGRGRAQRFRAPRWHANYRGLDPNEIRVVLLHSQDRILPEVAEKLALFAQKILAKRGVEIRLNTRLEAATGEEAVLAGGERIPTRTLVSTVPSSPHPLIEALALPKTKNGRLIADRCLRVEGRRDVWALGDCAQVPAPDGGFSPPTAQHAIRQATSGAHNIVAAIRGGEPERLRLHGSRQDGLARAPLRGRRDLRLQDLGLPRLVDLANDLPDEAARDGGAG